MTRERTDERMERDTDERMDRDGERMERDDDHDRMETRDATREVGNGSRGADAHALFSDEDIRRMNSRWEAIQSSFVEEPKESVRRADELVTDMMSIITDGFQRDRRELESQWDAEGDVSTETLRVTLQRYRAFFDRLLSTAH